jgi:hypothetical protein
VNQEVNYSSNNHRLQNRNAGIDMKFLHRLSLQHNLALYASTIRQIVFDIMRSTDCLYDKA